jgi:hypothetical protein
MSLLLLPLCGCYVVHNSALTQPQATPTLSVTPQNSCIVPGGTQQFVATFSNSATPPPSVDWFVDDVKGGSAQAGSISSGGLYGAPGTSGSHVIKAVQTTNSTVTGTVNVVVTTAAHFEVQPSAASLPMEGQQAFQGITCGVPNQNLAWSVDNILGGNAVVGTVDTTGIYTAPNAAGTHKVQATDPASGKSGTAVVAVGSTITVDFGARAPNPNAIPAGILGINHVDWLTKPSDQELVARAGFKISRSYADLSSIFKSKKPDWRQLDAAISTMQSSGFHVLLQLSFTPHWLQPKPNPCPSAPTTVAPTDVNAWATLARTVVAHMDESFPGVVSAYEIWNEPDSGGMCSRGDKLKTYLAIYSAAAQLMKQQAAGDGSSIQIGGPAASGVNPEWLTAFTTSSSTAPYVDFVSYHNYMGGTNQVNAKWDTSSGIPSLYQATQDDTSGAAADYTKASQLVAAGKQASAATTPLYVDEFNTNWKFAKDCCRNDPTYAPLWNALYVSDMLDSVYWAGTRVPGQLTYYSANTNPYFCVVGKWDTNMDCALGPHIDPVPYPQYFAYQLMASADYLGVNDGGYMAASVSPVARGEGITATAFFTARQESILIVNPTGKDATEVIAVSNSGLSSPSATLYQVMNGQSIATTNLPVSSSGSTLNMSISVPAYSVLGIALR